MDTAAPPDLVGAENRALLAARAVYDTCAAAQASPTAASSCHQALGELLTVYERLQP